jgi:uncharacterized protein YndB with AHSA1/START domain
MERITIKSKVKQPVDKVWDLWKEPAHIVKWNSPSADWHTPRAENDLRIGGRFLSRMEARDGSHGFDFSGTYDEVVLHKRIAYTMDDGRKALITFKGTNGETEVTISFDPETSNPVEMQRSGWQAILDSFKAYADKD